MNPVFFIMNAIVKLGENCKMRNWEATRYGLGVAVG